MNIHLSETEKQHPLWLKLQAALTEHLATLRARNDAVVEESATQALRGEIRAVKGFLEIGMTQDIQPSNDITPTARPAYIGDF